MNEKEFDKLAEIIRTEHVKGWGEPDATNKLSVSPWSSLSPARKKKWIDMAQAAFFHLQDTGWINGA